MRRTLIVVSMAVLVLVFAGVQAQDEGPCTIVAETGQGRLVVTFTEREDVLRLPNTMTVLSCVSSPDEVAQIAPAAPGGLNEGLPIPDNPEGLAEMQSGYAVVNTPFANLRGGDGPEFQRVAVVRGGTRLVVLGRNEARNWWYVQAGDVRGWIWNDIVVLRGDLTDVPIIETEAGLTPPTLYVGYTGNPIYDELSTEGEVVCTIQGQRENLVLGRNGGSTWYFIEAQCEDGRMAQGWINAQFGFFRNPAGVIVPDLAGR